MRFPGQRKQGNEIRVRKGEQDKCSTEAEHFFDLQNCPSRARKERETAEGFAKQAIQSELR